MYDNVNKAVVELKKAMETEGVDPTRGLPESLFIFSTTLVPVVNVDLFVTNDDHQLLLTWRDDIYYGRGWHIPGGCIRLKEKIEERIEITAENELGVSVEFDPIPMTVRETMENDNRPSLSDQNERCHNISLLYRCSVKKGYKLADKINGTPIKWFAEIPNDMIKTHLRLYGDILESYFSEGVKK